LDLCDAFLEQILHEDNGEHAVGHHAEDSSNEDQGEVLVFFTVVETHENILSNIKVYDFNYC